MLQLRLRSQKGQAVLTALMVALGVATVVGVLLDQSYTTDKLLKGPRIRSAMLGATQRLKLLALTPSSYICPQSASGAFSPSQCSLSFDAQMLNQYFPQAPCQGVPRCGVEVQNLNLVNTHLLADIVYTGRDLSFNPSHVDIAVPMEILQASQNDCFAMDPTKPVFAGFLPSGVPDCRPLQGQCTGLGQFVQSVDPKTLKVNCGTFQGPVGCPATQYMTSLKWSGGSFRTTCANRLDPFTKFSYVASVTFGAAAIAASPAPNPVNSCAPPPTTTTTTTTTLPASPGPAPAPLPAPAPASGPPDLGNGPGSQIAGCSGPNGEGPGVLMCISPSNGTSYNNNSCDLSKTGWACCYEWAPYDYDPAWPNAGGVSPPGPGVEGIGLKCGSKAYCEEAGVRDVRCTVRW